MSNDSTSKICVVSFPMRSVVVTNALLGNLLEILRGLGRDFVIVGPQIGISETNKVASSRVNGYRSKSSTFFMFIRDHIRIFLNLLACRKEVEVVLLCMGGAHLLPSVFLSKICGKKTLLLVQGRGSFSYKLTFQQRTTARLEKLLSGLLRLLENMSFHIADLLVVETESCATFLELTRFSDRLLCCGAPFVDLGTFSPTVPLSERNEIVGYVGRISDDKGVANLLKAIPLVLAQRPSTKFHFWGGGPLVAKIHDIIECTSASDSVKYLGWTRHESIPRVLDSIELLVLPSFSEGLPRVAIEAMACGTPVLATPVGAIPDIIKEGDTGFIMEDNSPECIARNVIRVLSHPNLEGIAENARTLVKGEYTYEAAVERYREILAILSTG